MKNLEKQLLEQTQDCIRHLHPKILLGIVFMGQ